MYLYLKIKLKLDTRCWDHGKCARAIEEEGVGWM